MKQTQQDLAPRNPAAATSPVAKSVRLNYRFAFWLIKKVQPVAAAAAAVEDDHNDEGYP